MKFMATKEDNIFSPFYLLLLDPGSGVWDGKKLIKIRINISDP
jgi:hypothetical protein